MTSKKPAPKKTLVKKPKRGATLRSRTERTKIPRERPQSFPIVGIGASAGGLEVFTQLLAALPLDTGLAFVRVRKANRAYYQMFQARPEETENRFVYDLGKAQWNTARLRELLDILPKNTRIENFELDVEFPGGGRKKLLLNASRIESDGQKMPRILLAMEETKSP